jgi:hypothetical protein
MHSGCVTKAPGWTRQTKTGPGAPPLSDVRGHGRSNDYLRENHVNTMSVGFFTLTLTIK